MTIKELVESLKGLDENSDVVIVFSPNLRAGSPYFRRKFVRFGQTSLGSG